MAQVIDPVFVATDLPPRSGRILPPDFVVRGLSAGSVGYPTSSAQLHPALCRGLEAARGHAAVRVAFSIRS